VRVRELTDADRSWARSLLDSAWGLPVVSISGAYDASTLPGFLADDDDNSVGVLTYRMGNRECEVVTLNSVRERRGVGAALLAAAKGVADVAGARLWLITVDTNLNAIGFYERQGMHVRAVHREFADKVRLIKPQAVLQFRDAIEYSY
jgi:GNAT superfamily N-acetyltransferase